MGKDQLRLQPHFARVRCFEPRRHEVLPSDCESGEERAACEAAAAEDTDCQQSEQAWLGFPS